MTKTIKSLFVVSVIILGLIAFYAAVYTVDKYRKCGEAKSYSILKGEYKEFITEKDRAKADTANGATCATGNYLYLFLF